MKRDFSIKAAIREGFELTLKHPQVTIVATLIFGAVEVAILVFEFMLRKQGIATMLVIGFPVFLMGYLFIAWLRAGWVMMALEGHANRQFELRKLFAGVQFVLPFVVAKLLVAVLIVLSIIPGLALMYTLFVWFGPDENESVTLWSATFYENLVSGYGIFFLIEFILLGMDVVPPVVVATYFGFALYLMVEKKLGGIEALRTSSKLSRGAMGKLVLFSIVVAQINLLGALCFGVGLLVTLPATSLAHIAVYRELALSLPPSCDS